MNSPKANSPSFKNLKTKQKQSPIAIKEKLKKVCTDVLAIHLHVLIY